ncbi:hypothetical protein [Dyadobacter sp. CY323]|uniref:hypothetical protein n=1 Tax=Dyadobacter sp. CY323 TaxID=2907302 RepID=UPI001F444F9E|nr:hypothetical protein [Dyadobacter sp. CY323]MCE6993189.1 hypothetical protein [Dyadobacter sp. CY323]
MITEIQLLGDSVNIRRSTLNFLQNLSDYLHGDKPPMQIPDYITGEMYTIAPDQEKTTKDFIKRTKDSLPNGYAVVMRNIEGVYQPIAAHTGSIPYLNAVTGNLNRKRPSQPANP